MFQEWLSTINRPLRRYNLTLLKIPGWLLGLLVAALWAAPFVWMVSTSFKPAKEVMTRKIEWFPRTVVLSNYIRVFQYPVGTWALNSLIVAITATIAGVILGAMCGYALARLNFPGKSLVFYTLIASLMIPTEMTIVPLYIGALKTGLINTYAGLILPTIAPVLSVYIFRQFFLGLPEELEDAAKIDGAGRFVMFWWIAFPLAKAPLIAASILLFTWNWNAFLWPLLVSFTENMKTMPVGIASFTPVIGSHTQIEGFGPAMAAITLLSLPSLLIFFVLQRYFIEGITTTGLKG